MPRKSKLSAAIVRKIYTSKEGVKDLAERYGVTPNYIYAIRQGRSRKDVTGAPIATKVRRGRKAIPASEGGMDINALADALIDRIVARLK